MTVIHRVLGQADSSIIPTQGIGFLKEKELFQTGTGTLPPGAAYKAFPTAYGTPPLISLSEPGSNSFRTKIGTYRADILRIRPGSFQWAGTPAITFRWFAVGFSA